MSSNAVSSGPDVPKAANCCEGPEEEEPSAKREDQAASPAALELPKAELQASALQQPAKSTEPLGDAGAAGADAGAGGSPSSLPSSSGTPSPRRIRKGKINTQAYQSVGVSSTEYLFHSEDKEELKRYLHLSRVVSKVASHISQAQGPLEILEWFWISCKQFWSEHSDITVKVFLRDTFVPESLALASFRRNFESGPNVDSEELCCLDMKAVAALRASNEKRPEQDLCQWCGASTTLPHSMWEFVDIGDFQALRTCFRQQKHVHDELQEWGFRYPEHEDMDNFKSFAYLPICVREDPLGVLMVASTGTKAFSAADRDTYNAVTEVAAVHLKALHMQFEMDRRRKEIEMDRARHRELASAYRELLNDMLPSHVVEMLADDRTPTAMCPDGDGCHASDLGEGGQEADERSSSKIPVPLLVEDADWSRQQRRLTRRKRRTTTGVGQVPSHITRQLDKLTYAEYHECVAILFSDVKGFTSLSEVADPAEIMVMLDDLFGRFDGIVERHAPAAYKVETIGDAYMIAFGLFGQTGFTEETPTDYAVALRAIVVGAEMIKASRKVFIPSCDRPVEVRIGLQFGRIMSGIIGKKVPRYCMFGDTVNTASRMESTGVPGRIHVTDSVHQACMQGAPGRDLPFQSTGGLQVKGKGWMQTFLLDPHKVLSLNLCPPEGKVTNMPFYRIQTSGEEPPPAAHPTPRKDLPRNYLASLADLASALCGSSRKH